jgi:hypothetical protein
MNQAGSDHGAAVPGRVAHFFDIVANELVGGLGMSGIKHAYSDNESGFIKVSLKHKKARWYRFEHF